jgi:hypothetical protein
MSDLAPYLRDRIASTSPADLAAALTAVLDRCEQMRVDANRGAPGTTHWAIGPRALATEFEQTIARALGPTD